MSPTSVQSFRVHTCTWMVVNQLTKHVAFSGPQFTRKLKILFKIGSHDRPRNKQPMFAGVEYTIISKGVIIRQSTVLPEKALSFRNYNLK